MTCPPCTSTCRQGRDCPHRPIYVVALSDIIIIFVMIGAVAAASVLVLTG